MLGVSEEELTQAMEDLGIAAADLLDPMTVRDLCMNLTGVEDSISLLTDANLYESVKETVQTAENAVASILDDFGITKEELTEITKDETFAAKIDESVAQRMKPKLRIRCRCKTWMSKITQT